VYDQGADGRTLYLAMEYVPGRTLRDLLHERTRLRPREALDIIEGVLSGLAAAHAAGIAHRDVKPENVLLGPAQSLKVADFGLARMLADATHTKSGLLIGTAAYLAPEQVAGGRSDFRTDVYATGVMLFELLTGFQPFTGDTPLAVAYRHVNEVVPAPSSLVPALPPALDSLVALATSRDPDLRPADAGQFLRAITATRHGLPLDAPLPAPYTAGAGAAGPPRPGPGLPGPGMPSPPAVSPGLPGAGPGLPGAPTVAGLAAAQGAPRPDASIADTAPPRPVVPPQAAAPPRAVVAPVWPAPPPADWPAQPTSSSGWPDPPQNGNDLNVIPGMPGGTAVPPYGGPSADPYRPATNQTLIVATADAPYGTTLRESWLGRQLFSHRLAYIAGALAVVLVFGLLGWWMFQGRYTIVPKVTGVSATAAQADLRDAGLTPGTTTTALDNGVAKGLVIRTNPSNGSRIARGGRVDLVVSAGPHMINMPQVTGQTLTDAQAAIKKAGLTPGKVKTITSTTIAAGVVISTNPTAGTSWPQPKPVSIVLSAGPPLPDFVGQDKAVAEQWAAANGVKLNEVTASHSNQPVNIVVKQSVPPGSAFTNGEVITIQFSPGPPMVNIPDVTGMRVPKAVQILRNAGFLVHIDAVGPFNVVFNESPTGTAPKGSTITLTTGLPHFG
jgi:serine/threonine-protein kinase